MTVKSTYAPSTKESDAEFIAEIPPPVLQRLKNGSLILLTLSFCCIFVLLPETSAQASMESPLIRLICDIGVVFAGVFFLVSIFKYPLLLRRELFYRRRHGKWRWER